jgi:twitching motility protein PilT
MFETHEEKHVRARLADSMRWIVCQRLLPKVGGARVAAFEVMGTNLRVKESIESGESEGKTFYEIIEGSQALGMMTFDQSIGKLFKRGLVTEQTAISYSTRRSVLGRTIDSIKATRGEKTTSIEGLDIDRGYGRTRKR